MFEPQAFFASFAAADIPKAKAFYQGILGLRVEEGQGMLHLESPDGNRILVYPRPGHKPAEFTVLNFVVDDIDAAVDALREKGVQFERYGGEIKTDLKGIHRGNPNVAWFRDPAGNIFGVMTRMTAG